LGVIDTARLTWPTRIPANQINPTPKDYPAGQIQTACLSKCRRQCQDSIIRH